MPARDEDARDTEDREDTVSGQPGDSQPGAAGGRQGEEPEQAASPRETAAGEGEPGDNEIAREVASEAEEFLPLMAHLYRGSLDRATKWRDRLDRTLHWSVLIVASLLTWTFSNRENPHAILLLAMVVVGVFLVMEARRYRRYDIWRTQVRLLEENVFANVLDPSGVEQAEWRRLLSEDLRRPAFKISVLESLSRRLRRSYLALLLVLLVAWIVRLTILSEPHEGVVTTAGIWVIPGSVVIGVVGLFYALLVGLTIWPIEREAKGRVRDRQEAVDVSKDME